MRRLVLVFLVVVTALAVSSSTASASTATTTTAAFTPVSGATLVYGSGTTVSGTVTGTGGTPTGTVTVLDGVTQIATGNLTAGAYQISLPLLSAGSHSISVNYGGDSDFATSGVTTPVNVAKRDALVSIAGPDDVWIGQTASYTLTVSGAPPPVQAVSAPTGTITAHGPGVSGTVFGTVPLSGGVAHLSVPSTVSPTVIYFDYSGDSNYNAGSMPKALNGPRPYNVLLTLTDSHGCTPTQSNGSCVTPVPGYPMLLVAVMSLMSGVPTPPSGMEPTGVVTFNDVTTGTSLGSVQLSGGVATIFTAFSSPGTHLVRASYNGDANFNFVSSTGDMPVFVIDANQVQRYVNWVYLDLLGRDGDQQGISYWAYLLETGTPRSATSWALVTSTEFRQETLSGMYEQFLQRDTDVGGLQYWTGQIAAGMTFEQFQCLLIGSDEYFLMGSKGGGSNAQFVQSMYRDILDRDVDQTGLDYFVGLLAHGTSRPQVVSAIVYSTEHLQSTVDGYYENFLGRPSDPAGRDYWVNQLQHGERDEKIIALIIGSDEYFDLT